MPVEDAVKRLGRVQYIEPNSLFVQSEGDKIQNGIPQPYEDYSFSVNLRVINGDRYSCGRTSDGGDITQSVLEYSSDNGTISFMDGTAMPGQQGYLTTNFTDISMNNPETNTKECLGIESISIKYDSWYYPTVTIKFVDVRGASLMLPSEYEYYNNGGPNFNKEKSHSTSNSDFFKAFFSFPYPMFKLSVKGFYGKEVTYDLSVLKCNIDFNSSTGHFEINASFIGYMYGMYADLPFQFAYLAPYISLYGKNTWDEKRNTGDFCYIDTEKENKQGIAMYTFPELRHKVEDAGQESDKLRAESAKGKMLEWTNKLSEKIDTAVLKNYPPAPKNGTSWWSWSKKNTESPKNGYFFVVVDESDKVKRTIFDNFYAFSRELHDYNNMVSSGETELSNCNDKGEESLEKYSIKYKSAFEKIYNDSEALVTSMKDRGITEYPTDEVTEILKKNLAFLHFTKNDSDKEKIVLQIEGDSTYGSGSRPEYEDLIVELQTRFKNDEVNSPMNRNSSEKSWMVYALRVDDIDYRKDIVNTSNELKKAHDELVSELAELRIQYIVDAIGFNPTMRNMFNMVFAHIDTFMSVYYNTLDRIRKSIQSSDDDSRSYEKLCGGNGSSKIEVDVSDNILKNREVSKGKLPPFTLFYKEETVEDTEDKKFTILWPGDLDGGNGKDLDEVKLVEAIVNATALNRRDFEPVMPRDNVIPLRGNIVPTNYYDIIRGETNPYLDVLNDKTLSDTDILNAVVNVFLFRCYYALLNGSYVAPNEGETNDGLSTDVAKFTKKAKLVAKLEAGNVARAFQMLKMSPKSAFITGLHRITENGATILSEKLRGTNPRFIATPVDEITYNWIRRSDYACLPVGVFVNSILENFASGAEGFKSLGKYADRFLKVKKTGTEVNGDYSCRIYSGGKYIEEALSKYGTGDFVMASRLFKNYGSTPSCLSGLTISKVPNIPSVRKTGGGNTSVFMDPLYYSQENTYSDGEVRSRAIESRAYLFLMGIPYGDGASFFIPEKVENGDYPTLMLLREGAVYWRNSLITALTDEGAPLAELEGDPISYKYTMNGITTDALPDIEKNDPRFGVRRAVEFYNKNSNGASEGRKQILIDYFLKWANGIKISAPNSIYADAKYAKPEIPSTLISFPEIESNFALWETSGQLKTLLTPESCISAVTKEFAKDFANYTTLKENYEIGPDGRLGSVNGKIRTKVYTKEADKGDFFVNFDRFYLGNDTIIDFSCLDEPNRTFSVPRNAMNDALTAFVKELKYQNGVTNEQLKRKNVTDGSGVPEDSYEKPEQFKGSELKLACYIALKNMYDRWLCSRRRESWYFSIIPERLINNGIRSDFQRFFYIDEFYHDIGMSIRPNITRTAEMVCKEGGFTEKTDEAKLAGSSIMKILSNIGEFGGCALLTLPTMLGLAKSYTEDNNSIEDVFRAIPYNDAVRTDGVETSFILLYTSMKSSVLENEKDSGKNGYKTDGFDIANTWGEIVPQSMFTDGGEDGFVVPAFGVTFAKQNQSYFKDIRLSMEDHKVTEYSIKNEIMISYQQNTGPRETTILGQDLFSVYSNYSYSCDVSMLGDAQITPLMYFQLNNIPMWKGAYLITNVHHDISVGRMETVFTGVRQARPTLPFKGKEIDNGPADITKETVQSQAEPEGKPLNDTKNISERRLDKINVDDVDSIVFVLDRTSFITSEHWINGILSANVYYKDKKGTPVIIDYVANTIEATHGLTGRIQDFTPETVDVLFSIPSGRYSNVYVENPPAGSEYRDPNDSFYGFTDGKHITVSDFRLGNKMCEIITGETKYDVIDEGGFKDICFGGASPIMIYAEDVNSSQEDYNANLQFDKDEIRATYREIFSLVKRMNDAKKPLTFLVNEIGDLEKKKVKK